MGVNRLVFSLVLAAFLGLTCSLGVAWGGAAFQFYVHKGARVGHHDADYRYYYGEGTFACDRLNTGYPTCGTGLPDEVPREDWAPAYLRSVAARVTGPGAFEHARLYAAGWPRRCVAGGVKESYFTGRYTTDGKTFIDDIDALPSDVDVWIVPEATPHLALIADRKSEAMRLGGTRRTFLALPYGPVWSGLAVNTAFFGGIWWIAFPVRRGARRAWRTRRGRCPRCGYDLAGDPHAGCPECGMGLAAAQQ